MLTEKYSPDALRGMLLGRDGFKPYPKASDRDAWEALPGFLKEEITKSAEGALAQEWPVLPATLFMRYRRDGNRSMYERNSFARRNMLSALVLGECVEGAGRYLDHIVDGVWAICEESFWGVPAHNNSGVFPNPALPYTAVRDIDLFAAETAATLAFTHYLLDDALDGVTPILRDRIGREAHERIIQPYLERDDFWWMGFTPRREVNNWNPWINSNVLMTALLLEPETERRTALVAKALRSIDRFIGVYHEDGGCDEGTSYWGHAGGSLFDCLEALHAATRGGIDVYDQPVIANIGRYLYRMNICGDWFVNFADGGARVGISANLVYLYGTRIGDERLMALGAAEYSRYRGAGRIFEYAKNLGSLNRMLSTVFNINELEAAISSADPGKALVLDSWLPGVQVMAARGMEGSGQGLFVAAKGGHNEESHNHNDIGQFIVFNDGVPGIIDVGVETYTAKTFSARRYEIWTMQSAYHNLPTVNGVQQAPGYGYAAQGVSYENGPEGSSLKLDIAGAYPPEAGIRRWERTVSFTRAEGDARVVVADSFELGTPGPVTMTLMTARRPGLPGDGRITIPPDDGGRGGLVISGVPHGMTVTVEEIPIDDARLGLVWGKAIFRVLFGTTVPVDSGEWRMVVSRA